MLPNLETRYLFNNYVVQFTGTFSNKVPFQHPCDEQSTGSFSNMLPSFETRYLFNIYVMSNPPSFTETTSQF
jgi:hypothetical protein